MCRSWMSFISLSLSIAFLVWGCGGRGPVEEGDWGDTSSGSGSSSSGGGYVGRDTPGAASSGTKYEAAPSGLRGHRQNWSEADERALEEIQKQQIEALVAYQAYMKGKEAGNMDTALLQRAIQLYEQTRNKLDPLIEKYPGEEVLDKIGEDVITKLRALEDDLHVR